MDYQDGVLGTKVNSLSYGQEVQQGRKVPYSSFQKIAIVVGAIFIATAITAAVAATLIYAPFVALPTATLIFNTLGLTTPALLGIASAGTFVVGVLFLITVRHVRKPVLPATPLSPYLPQNPKLIEQGPSQIEQEPSQIEQEPSSQTKPPSQDGNGDEDSIPKRENSLLRGAGSPISQEDPKDLGEESETEKDPVTTPSPLRKLGGGFALELFPLEDELNDAPGAALEVASSRGTRVSSLKKIFEPTTSTPPKGVPSSSSSVKKKAPDPKNSPSPIPNRKSELSLIPVPTIGTQKEYLKYKAEHARVEEEYYNSGYDVEKLNRKHGLELAIEAWEKSQQNVTIEVVDNENPFLSSLSKSIPEAPSPELDEKERAAVGEQSLKTPDASGKPLENEQEVRTINHQDQYLKYQAEYDILYGKLYGNTHSDEQYSDDAWINCMRLSALEEAIKKWKSLSPPAPNSIVKSNVVKNSLIDKQSSSSSSSSSSFSSSSSSSLFATSFASMSLPKPPSTSQPLLEGGFLANIARGRNLLRTAAPSSVSSPKSPPSQVEHIVGALGERRSKLAVEDDDETEAAEKRIKEKVKALPKPKITSENEYWKLASKCISLYEEIEKSEDIDDGKEDLEAEHEVILAALTRYENSQEKMSHLTPGGPDDEECTTSEAESKRSREDEGEIPGPPPPPPSGPSTFEQTNSALDVQAIKQGVKGLKKSSRAQQKEQEKSTMDALREKLAQHNKRQEAQVHGEDWDGDKDED